MSEDLKPLVGESGAGPEPPPVGGAPPAKAAESGGGLPATVVGPRAVYYGLQAGYLEPIDEDGEPLTTEDRFPVPTHASPTIPPYRPHIIERPLRRINAFYLPRARARTAMVIVTPKSGPVPVGPDGRPTKVAEIFWNGGTLYEVDLGLQHTTLELDLPADGDFFAFRLTAEVEWRVIAPERVVADNLRDVRQALTLGLRNRLSHLTRMHDIGEVRAAEADIRRELTRHDPGARYGLCTTIVPRLVTDDRTQDYATNRRDLERQITIEELRHQHQRVLERHEHELLEARRQEYRQIIASGNVDQFALQLARNPQDVQAVVQLAMQERHEERRQLTDFITRMLQSGAVDRWDVEDQVRAALEWLAESTGRVLRTDLSALPEQRSGSGAEQLTAPRPSNN